MKGKQRILIVDDTPSNIKILNDLLKADYTVSFAINGKDALTLAQSENPPDLILLDVVMPEMDGYQVCRHLKQNKITARIPVIFITAMTDAKDEMKGFAVGGVDYITKPISPSVVKARINTHLSLKSAQKKADHLLSKTLIGSIRMMADVMSFVDPDHFRQASRVKRVTSQIGRELRLRGIWQLEIAATLSQIGRIALTSDVIDKVKTCQLLTEKEQEMMKASAMAGKELLAYIPSMGGVAEIIGRQHDPLPGQDIKNWDFFTTSAQILKLVCAYEQLILCGQQSSEAIALLESRTKLYPRELVKLLKKVEQSRTGGVAKNVTIEQLQEGMVLMEDLLCDDGVVLIKRYTELSEDTLLLLKKNAKIRSVMSSVKVITPA